jgi:predicted DNA-binding WGR domain protein
MQHSIHLIRTEAALNMARFYQIGLQPTLFGEVALLRRWGRIGTLGQQKMQSFAGVEAALVAQARLAQAKQRRGYRPVP